MDPVAGLGLGFQLALTPTNLLFALVGCLVGTAIGVLPGIGPVSGVAILLPVIFASRVDPTSGMIMLAAVYYGSQYGGSTTSILINTPGESSSVMTCLDGYAMAKKGRAGPALAMAAIASFVAGTLAVLGLMLLAPPLTEFALGFGPHENAALKVLGLTTLTRLAGKSVLKALLMAAFGLLLGTVGIDSMSGTPRFTFGSGALLNGFDFAVVAIGLFAFAELLSNAEESLDRPVIRTKLRDLWPTAADWLAVRWTLLRAMYIGNVLLRILNLPLVGVWASILRIPYGILLPFIVLFTLIGTYAINNDIFDIWVMVAFGVLGWIMRKFDYPAAPVVLALVLGPQLETNFRRALTISQGDYTSFLVHPIAATLLVLAVLSLVWPILVRLVRGRPTEVPIAVEEA